MRKTRICPFERRRSQAQDRRRRLMPALGRAQPEPLRSPSPGAPPADRDDPRGILPILRQYQRLIDRIASRYRKLDRAIERDDLVQDLALAAIQAVETRDPTRHTVPFVVHFQGCAKKILRQRFHGHDKEVRVIRRDTGDVVACMSYNQYARKKASYASSDYEIQIQPLVIPLADAGLEHDADD